MRKIKPLRKTSESRINRAMGENSGFELHLPSKNENKTGISEHYQHHDFHKELRNAVLEAERHKAQSLMNLQRRNLAH